ncbi:hypothetical protein B0H14DRAFT_3505976 [Mycena olivaceomarginata]|nr:hypothetical protein B0H14DRAFT_3505976 [Mycena olivaceomarginata]
MGPTQREGTVRVGSRRRGVPPLVTSAELRLLVRGRGFSVSSLLCREAHTRAPRLGVGDGEVYMSVALKEAGNRRSSDVVNGSILASTMTHASELPPPATSSTAALRQDHKGDVRYTSRSSEERRARATRCRCCGSHASTG